MRLRAVTRGSVFGILRTSQRGMTTVAASPIEYKTIDSTTHPHAQIGIISLNRPNARNALSRGLIDSLRQITDRLSEDVGAVRGIILKSESRGMFCAGADLVERRTMRPDQVSLFLTDMRAAFRGLSEVSVPTISVIDGHALGGGLELSLCTDIRVLGPHARVGLPETRLGIIPGAGGTQRLTRLVGAAKTKDMVFAARIMGGEEAVRHGIGQYYSRDPYAKAIELMETYIQNSPIGIAQAKRAIDFATTKGHALESGLDFEREMYNVCMQGSDRDEGLLAFKEKRKPIYGVPNGHLKLKSNI